MARGAELERFAKEHDLELLSVADLIRFRRRMEPQVRRVVETALPTAYGPFRAIGYAGVDDRVEHVALVAGSADGAVPVHLHTECPSGDVLRSTACACRRELDGAMARFAAEGRGVVVYLWSAGPARACDLFDGEADLDAELVAAEWILADLGVRSLAG